MKRFAFFRNYNRSIESSPPNLEQADPPPLYLDARRLLAERFLCGEGLEIGALHQPLAVPPYAHVRYVDRMTVADLRREYPELADWDLTEVDVIDDGEALRTIDPGSQDFIIANHFLEHCENPLGTIEAHFEKLKPGGVLFYAVPDKRYTFDFRRPSTSMEHFAADYEQGPEGSRREHFEEWAALVDDQPPERVLGRARELEEIGYSIHMHVWTQAEFLRLVLHCRERLDDGFDLEAAARQGIEFIVVLRKHGHFPAPPAPADPKSAPAKRWRTRLRRAAGAARRQMRQTPRG